MSVSIPEKFFYFEWFRCGFTVSLAKDAQLSLSLPALAEWVELRSAGAEGRRVLPARFRARFG
jgi:hypothetical protein